MIRADIERFRSSNLVQQTQTHHDGRRARGVETKGLILRSAITTIASLGFSNLTMTRVAERVGVSHALVVFHFKSKNLLIKEVLDFLGASYGNGWDAVATASNGSAMERLLDLVDYDIQFACENPEYVSAWHAFWGESKGNIIYRELATPRDNRYKNEMENLLATIIDEGGYSTTELPLIINGLYAMLVGLWTESHLDPKPGNCKTGEATVRLFLGKFFPNLTLKTA
jgi:AcrR family transcriptional regulator